MGAFEINTISSLIYFTLSVEFTFPASVDLFFFKFQAIYAKRHNARVLLNNQLEVRSEQGSAIIYASENSIITLIRGYAPSDLFSQIKIIIEQTKRVYPNMQYTTSYLCPKCIASSTELTFDLPKKKIEDLKEVVFKCGHKYKEQDFSIGYLQPSSGKLFPRIIF